MINISFQQLHYLIALDKHKNFINAADACNISQPTLSMQIKKLEDDLGTLIFDRTKHPIAPTPFGKIVVEQARKIIGEKHKLEQLIHDQLGLLEGELAIGIIPTLAPYLAPLFAGTFSRSFPNIHLKITESITERLINLLNDDEIDIAILATPLNNRHIIEEPLFYEKFMVYTHFSLVPKFKNSIPANDLAKLKLWVLSEGNCFRNQTINLCSMDNQAHHSGFSYDSGSIDGLMRLVDKEGGATIVPELSVLQLSEDKIDQLLFIKPENPVREISLAFNRRFARFQLLQKLKETIIDCLPPQVRQNLSDGMVPTHFR